MVTSCPEVRLTPYIGAVVLKDDLQRRPGVSSPQVVGFAAWTSAVAPVASSSFMGIVSVAGDPAIKSSGFVPFSNLGKAGTENTIKVKHAIKWALESIL